MMRVRTLGESTIEVGAIRIGPDSVVLFGLLLFLSMQRGRPVPRARIRELFWPDVPEAKSSHSLRQLLYRMRQLGVVIEGTPSHITLASDGVTVDFSAIDLREASADPRACMNGEMGPFLDGYAPEFSKPFASWVDEQRAVIHAKVRNVLLIAVASSRAGGDWSAVERLARSILTIDPLNEEATLSLAEATALSGSKVEAIAMLDKYVAEIGPERARLLKLPPTVLRRRIADTLSDSIGRRHLEGAFVGRSASMTILHNAMQNTMVRYGESHFIWGAAGIGKTRLIEEFIQGARLLGIRSERVTCQPSDRQRPMSIFSELSQKLLDLPGALGCSPTSYDFLRRLSAPDVPGGPASAEAATAGVLAANIRNALYDVLDAVSAERCLVIVIEDFHWADEQSAQLLGEMVEWARQRCLAFIITSRTDQTPPGIRIRKHALPPLDPSAIHALVCSLLPIAEELAPDVIDRWVRYSEGNPFYLRELVAHWQTTGDASSIPLSLSALLIQRLSGLSETASVALRTIAVLGRNCTADRLLAVLQCPNRDLIPAIDELERQGLVKGTRESIVCAHEMISRAAMETLSPLAFQMLHRLAALALEKENRPFSAAHILWDCTRHWDCAGDPARGLELTIECAKQLLELGLPNEAASLLTAARTLATGADSLTALLGALAQALHYGGRWHELHDVLQERRACAVPPQTAHDHWELLLVEAAWRRHDRNHSDLLDHATHCARAAEASVSHRIRATSQGIRMAAECCNRERARELYAAMVALPPEDSPEPTLRAEMETVYHTSFGDLDLGAAAAGRLVATCRVGGNHSEIARALRFASLPLRLVGRVSDAEKVLIESLDIARKYGLRTAETQAAYRLGVHYLALGEPARTLEWCAEITALDPKAEDHFSGSCLSLLALQAFLALGDSKSAALEYSSIADFEVMDGLTRVANEFVAARLRMRLETAAGHITRSEVTNLLRLHRRTRNMGAEDFAAGTLFRALAAIGDKARALVLFNDYTAKHRRDRIPFEPGLAEFVRLVLPQQAQNVAKPTSVAAPRRVGVHLTGAESSPAIWAPYNEE